MSVEINKSEDVVINTTQDVSVELKTAEEVETTPEYSLEAQIKKYTVVGDDIYIANQTDTLPLWFQTTLDTFVSNNSTLSTGVDILTTNFNNFETGYNIKIAEVDNGIDGLTTSVTTLLNDNGLNKAAILDIQTTKVDADGAAAAAQTVIGAWQVDPLGGGAFFDNKISAFSNDLESQATSITSLSSQYNGVEARIDTIEYTTTDINGYTAGASKLITAPDGGLTGWQFVDGTNQVSDMTIYATNFKITDGTTNDTPFSITGNKVNFDGVVNFTNTNIANGLPGSTTINGGLVQTGRVESSNGTTYIDLDANQIKMYNAGNGFTLNSTAAGTTNDPTIQGGYIKGGTVEGSTITGTNISGAYIYGTTIDSSTMKVRDLIVYTDHDKLTDTVISDESEYVYTLGGPPAYIKFNLFGSNSVNTPRIASTGPLTYTCSGFNSWSDAYGTITYKGWYLFASMNLDSWNTLRITVNVNGNIVYSDRQSAGEFSINGIKFYLNIVGQPGSEGGVLWMAPYSKLTSGTGDDGIRISFKRSLSGNWYDITQFGHSPVNMIIYNL